MEVGSGRKNFSKKFEKPLDICPDICYNTITEGNKEENKMTNEYWEAHEAEWLAAQECMEWLLFEADMATDPYRD